MSCSSRWYYVGTDKLLQAGIWLLIMTLAGGCLSDQSSAKQPRKPHRVSTLADDGRLNMIVEIPAGTNDKFEYDSDLRKFKQDTIAGGQPRVIRFLPYPGNYGFIPSTLMDKSDGGDGDPLDILLIGPSVPRGNRVAVHPIAALLLRDRGELDTKIIAVPAHSEQRTIDVDNYMSFLIEYPAAHRIIEDWFLHYKGPGLTELIRWEDEAYAWSEIDRWKVKQ